MKEKPPRFIYFPAIDTHPHALLTHTRFPYQLFIIDWKNTYPGFELHLDKSLSEACDDKKLQGIKRSGIHWLYAQIERGLIHKPVVK